MADSKGSSGGIGVLGLLGVLFVGLKLGNVIDWSWRYVTLPFWGGLVIGILIMIGIVIWAIIQALKNG